MPTISWTEYTEDDEEVLHELPAKFEVCHRCVGEGKHVNPNVDGHGISRDEFDEDPDFKEDYFSGVYDVQCHECQGNRVVPVLDEENCDKEILKRYKEYLEDEYNYNQECESERRMGA